MPSENIVILTGHLGKDPESKTLQNGTIMAKFTLATSIGRDDDKKTQWHSCTIFGSRATELVLGAAKGDVVSLRGRIEYRKWEEKYFTDIIVDHLKVTKKVKPRPRVDDDDEFVDEDVPL